MSHMTFLLMWENLVTWPYIAPREAEKCGFSKRNTMGFPRTTLPRVLLSRTKYGINTGKELEISMY